MTGESYASALREVLLDPWHFDRIIGQGPELATPKPWALPFDSHLGPWTPADLGVGGSIICISSATLWARSGLDRERRSVARGVGLAPVRR